jgi:hypothetical protein
MAEGFFERRRARRGADVPGRAVSDLPAIVDDDDARADALDDLEDMRAEQDGPTLGGEFLEQLLHDCGGIGVEPVERFIKKENFRTMEESRRDEHLLPHALGELVHALIPDVAEPKKIE